MELPNGRRTVDAHDEHDLTLLTGHASGNISGPELDEASALITECPTCAQLSADLRAIAEATRSLAAVSPIRQRDFRLSPEHAERLRRGGAFRRLLRAISGGSPIVQPLAAALTTLGLAGLLLTTVLPGGLGLVGGFGSAGSAPGLSAVGGPVANQFGTQASPAVAPEVGAGASAASAPEAVQTAPTTSGEKAAVPTSAPAPGAVGVATPGPQAATGQPADATRSSTPTTEISWTPILAVGSAVLLLAGLVLFGLRFAARRAV